jgi:hypothetical protein
MNNSGRKQALIAAAAIIAAMVLAPVSYDLHQGLKSSTAMAGNGHGNGNGGGNGNAGGDGNGNAGGNASANGAGNGSSHANNSVGGPDDSTEGTDNATADASGLGALNAAHASTAAFANASDSSRVGRIRAYQTALDKYLADCAADCSADLSADITDISSALAAAANKTLSTDGLNQLNGLLGESTTVDPNWDSTTAPDIVDQANAIP